MTEPSPQPRQRVSVIVEWENVQVAELDRARRMLAQLRVQAAELRLGAGAGGDAAAFLGGFHDPVEVVILFDDEVVAAEQIAGIVHPIIPPGDPDVELRLLAAAGNEYYDQKNFGTRQATGDYVVFLDSDVIPEPGWLQALLGALADPAVDVVGGVAYIDPYSTYAKAFALAWFFPLRSGDGAPVRTDKFFANNLAARRELFLRYPFPAMPEGMTRGACTLLARQFVADGVGVFRHPGARVSHPPPVGVMNFVSRALAEGRDDVLSGQVLHAAGERGLRASFGRWRRRMSGVVGRLLSQRREVGLSWLALPVAGAIAAAYYTLHATGNVMTRVHPEFMRRRFQL